MIHLILFIHKQSGANGRLLEKIINKTFAEIYKEKLQTILELETCLKRPLPLDVRNIYILLADSQKRLQQLIDVFDESDDNKTLLILPDENRETITNGHKLMPRFATGPHDGFMDLCAVLTKMIETLKMTRRTETAHRRMPQLEFLEESAGLPKR